MDRIPLRNMKSYPLCEEYKRSASIMRKRNDKEKLGLQEIIDEHSLENRDDKV